MTTPEPLTPPDCDLRGLDYMPLYAARLLDSDLVALTSGDEFKAAVILWCKAWSQPGASLPNDDRILAYWAGVKREDWPPMREAVMRGWIVCSDGRLYHPTLSEAARLAWEARVKYETRAGTFGEKQRQRALRGWAKRKAGLTKNDAAAYATAQFRHCRGNANERERDILDSSDTSYPQSLSANADVKVSEIAETAQSAHASKPKKRAKRATGCESFEAAWKAWPRKDRSSKARSLRLWDDCQAEPERKLAAVTRYLAGRDAKRDAGAYVPAFERWLRDRLESFLEIDTAHSASASVAPPVIPPGPPAFERFARVVAANEPAAWKSYGRGCRGEERDGELHVFAPSPTAQERLSLLADRMAPLLPFPVFVFAEGGAPAR